MLPAIVMYAYYGKIVGDVAKLAAGVSPPRGIEYWTLVGIGLVATILATHAITRAARRAMEQQRIAETTQRADARVGTQASVAAAVSRIHSHALSDRCAVSAPDSA